MRTFVDAGLIVCGHMAIKTDGEARISVPNSRVKMQKRLLHKVVRLGHLDRLVSPEEFVQGTGLCVEMAGKIIKPKKININFKPKQVTSFIKI